MSDPLSDLLFPALLLLMLLQAKHMFADFFLQTPRMLADRARYVHLGRFQHAGVHMAGSAIALGLVGAPLVALVLICLVEGVAHYHIDWLKGVWSARTGDAPTDARFWRAYGIDQLAHQLTYVAMIWLWAIAVIG